MGHAVELLDKQCDVWLAAKVLESIPLEFDSFPTLRELEDHIKKIREECRMTAAPMAEKPWVSEQAPGTPAAMEALFLWYKSNNHGHSAWDWGTSWVGVKSMLFMDSYDAWVAGTVHPRIAELRDKGRYDFKRFMQFIKEGNDFKRPNVSVS